MDTGVLDFFNKKLIVDYYFCLKSGPVFLFQIFIIAPPPSCYFCYNKNVNITCNAHDVFLELPSSGTLKIERLES